MKRKQDDASGEGDSRDYEVVYRLKYYKTRNICFSFCNICVIVYWMLKTGGYVS